MPHVFSSPDRKHRYFFTHHSIVGRREVHAQKVAPGCWRLIDHLLACQCVIHAFVPSGPCDAPLGFIFFGAVLAKRFIIIA